MPGRVGAVILAAGLSSRLAPRNKLLTPMPDGGTLIAHTARRAVASRAGMIIAVTGFQSAQIQAALHGLPVNFVFAEDFADGLAASLRAGIAALPPKMDAALIMLGDMPLIETDLLNALIEAYDPQTGHDIVVPTWQGQLGNPRLWGRRYFDEIRSLKGDTGANRLLSRYRPRIVECAAPSDAVLRDFDTPAALAQYGLA
jgi:molybdenum cofactor cytidylyltransferase